MQKKPDDGFSEFIVKEYPKLGNNPMAWTFEDETWTDYQAYNMAKKAYEAGIKVGSQIDKILLSEAE